ncbi:MAG: hypothetical protein JNK05_37730 [Myxococcales bacterium]|nr:hypothetical protein [Myxococcales bacterium]
MTVIAPDDLDYNPSFGNYLYRGEPFTGVVSATTERDGGIWKHEYRHGLRWGRSTVWDDAGEVSEDSQYFRDVWHGLAREWDDEGRLVRASLSIIGVELLRRCWSGEGELVEDSDLRMSPDVLDAERRLRAYYDDAPAVPRSWDDVDLVTFVDW